jgi:hypothetical protein
VDPVPDPLFLRKSRSAGNLTRISGSVTKISTTEPQRRLLDVLAFLSLVILYGRSVFSQIETKKQRQNCDENAREQS